MNDYGHVDDDTPSFAISLYKENRGRGIGTELMRRMLGLLKTDYSMLRSDNKTFKKHIQYFLK